MGDILCTGKSFVLIHIHTQPSINQSGVKIRAIQDYTEPDCPVQRDAERTAVFGASKTKMGASVKTKNKTSVADRWYLTTLDQWS
jgi:hypothetical protein